MAVTGYEIRVDGSTVIDAGLVHTYTVTGLSSGIHTFEIRSYDSSGNRSAWSSQVVANAFDAIAIRLDCGRTTGGIVSGYDDDSAYIVGSVGAQDFADTVDISGLTNPAPAGDYSTQRVLNADPIKYVFNHASMVAGKTYLLRCHFNEANASHVLGDSVMVVKINGTEAAPIRDSAFRNSKYFDVSERAGGFHKGYIREYLATADGSGEIEVIVTNAVNAAATDVKIAAIELLEAPPVASFSATPGANQTAAVVFADTSTGNPTSWAWDFGDGQSSTSQNPSHTYTNAGDYTVSLTATNPYGDSETYSATVTVPSASALTVTPSSLPAATQGVAYSQAISATGGSGPYTAALVSESSDARDYTDLGSGFTESVRRGALPNGLTLSGNTISGTPNLAAAKPSLIVLEGDSIIRGAITADPATDADYTPGHHLAKLLPRSWKVVQVATSGQQLGQMATDYTTQVAPYYDADYEYCIAFLAGGTNDILGSVSLATMKTKTQDWVSAAKADGFLVIVGKMIVNWSWSGSFLADATAYNAWIDSTLVGADAVVDWTDNPLLANSQHNTYYHDTGVHNTELGYIERAKEIKVAIDKLTPGGTGAIAVDYKFAVKVTDSLGNAQTKQYTLTVNP